MPWRENPELLLKMIAGYGHSANRAGGSTTQPANGGSDGSKLSFDELPLPALRRPLLTLLYQRARSFRLYREQVSSLYTFGYGLFRDYFLALGDHFVRRGVIETRQDIFYLYLDEVREIAAGGETDYADRVAERQQADGRLPGCGLTRHHLWQPATAYRLPHGHHPGRHADLTRLLPGAGSGHWRLA